jgi:hypothetical protein
MARNKTEPVQSPTLTDDETSDLQATLVEAEPPRYKTARPAVEPTQATLVEGGHNAKHEHNVSEPTQATFVEEDPKAKSGHNLFAPTQATLVEDDHKVKREWNVAEPTQATLVEACPKAKSAGIIYAPTQATLVEADHAEDGKDALSPLGDVQPTLVEPEITRIDEKTDRKAPFEKQMSLQLARDDSDMTATADSPPQRDAEKRRMVHFGATLMNTVSRNSSQQHISGEKDSDGTQPYALPSTQVDADQTQAYVLTSTQIDPETALEGMTRLVDMDATLAYDVSSTQVAETVGHFDYQHCCYCCWLLLFLL